MYQMVIADDEFYIRDGLCRMNWAQYGIEVAASCKNGAEAAKFIYENPVDILLTDLHMPIISGLELIEDISARFPHVKMVALTAYDDFEYIRTCLRSGAVDYVLKPVSEESLGRTFAAVREILDKETSERKRLAELERVNGMKTLALRREWMEHLFRDEMDDERMEEIAVYCEIMLDAPYFYICLIRPDHPEALAEPDLELQVFSFRNAMEEFCTDGATCFYIDPETAACYFLRGCQNPLSGAESRELAESIERRLYRMRGMFRCTLSWAAVTARGRHSIPGCTAMLEQFLSGAPDGAQKVFDSAGTAPPAAPGPPEPDRREAADRGGRRHLIRMVMQYIHEHYASPITLQSAAESVFVSQSYLSHVFKQETGQNFTKYLTQYRIGEACRLLRETNRRVYDIVRMVGYDNPKYFSEVFKQIVGMTPGAYRQEGESQ